jgi:peptidoglycan/LPS O-acetylase OafA/YrhL
MSDVAGAARPAKNRRYPILDALRSILALWVTVDHLAVFPLFAWADTTTKLGRFLVHGWATVVFGTPAVIGFFIISGFCIHLPFRNNEKLYVGRYYARRYTRILVPVIAALVVWRFAGFKQGLLGEHSILWESPLWSLLCEEIYYLLYPLIRQVRWRYGWALLFSVTFPLSVGISLSHVRATDWLLYGPIGTAFILLPVWLLGCVLAEKSDHVAALNSKWEIWGWRFMIWLASWTSEMLHFKFGVHTGVTMLWFGVLAFYWVKKEIAYGLNNSPSRLLVWAGAWSYSLYLIHGAAAEFYKLIPVPNLSVVVNWFLYYGFVLGSSYLFYLVIERPSHLLARKIRITPHPKSPKPLAL